MSGSTEATVAAPTKVAAPNGASSNDGIAALFDNLYTMVHTPPPTPRDTETAEDDAAEHATTTQAVPLLPLQKVNSAATSAPHALSSAVITLIDQIVTKLFPYEEKVELTAEQSQEYRTQLLTAHSLIYERLSSSSTSLCYRRAALFILHALVISTNQVLVTAVFDPLLYAYVTLTVPMKYETNLLLNRLYLSYLLNEWFSSQTIIFRRTTIINLKKWFDSYSTAAAAQLAHTNMSTTTSMSTSSSSTMNTNATNMSSSTTAAMINGGFNRMVSFSPGVSSSPHLYPVDGHDTSGLMNDPAMIGQGSPLSASELVEYEQIIKQNRGQSRGEKRRRILYDSESNSDNEISQQQTIQSMNPFSSSLLSLQSSKSRHRRIINRPSIERSAVTAIEKLRTKSKKVLYDEKRRAEGRDGSYDDADIDDDWQMIVNSRTADNCSRSEWLRRWNTADAFHLGDVVSDDEYDHQEELPPRTQMMAMANTMATGFLPPPPQTSTPQYNNLTSFLPHQHSMPYANNTQLPTAATSWNPYFPSQDVGNTDYMTNNMQQTALHPAVALQSTVNTSNPLFAVMPVVPIMTNKAPVQLQPSMYDEPRGMFAPSSTAAVPSANMSAATTIFPSPPVAALTSSARIFGNGLYGR